MLTKILFAAGFVLVAFLLNLYYRGYARRIWAKHPSRLRLALRVLLGYFVLQLIGFSHGLLDGAPETYRFRIYTSGIAICLMMVQIIALPFSLFDLAHWKLHRRRSKKKTGSPDAMPRRQFLTYLAAGAAAVPIVSLSYGIIRGPYRHRIYKQNIFFPALPDVLEGLRAVHFSDLHAGSWFSPKFIEPAVEDMLAFEPDIVLFGGDLVNYMTEEAFPFYPFLEKLKAPLGCYAVLGNHDFGTYKYQKDDYPRLAKHMKDMEDFYKGLGWRLLRDDSLPIAKRESTFWLAGCDNWGTRAESQQWGNLENTLADVPQGSFTVLLSHDPSHWDAQIRPHRKKVDLTLSGHTHGMQFGVETKHFQFSPIQLRYKQWAGLYQEGQEQLYVNRGLGFIGYPGRAGIGPEIALLTLKKHPSP